MSGTSREATGGTGHCACGGVQYRVTGPLRSVWNCHCDRCRRTIGHFMAAAACETQDLVLEAEATLRWYTPAEEPSVQYGFCDHCGGSLFWRSDARPEVVSICAGTLDPPTGLETVRALFTAEASDYHLLAEGLDTPPNNAGPR